MPSIKEFVEKYRVVIDDGKMRMFDIPNKEKEQVYAFAKQNLNAIVQYLSTENQQTFDKEIQEDVNAIKTAEKKRETQYGFYAKTIGAGVSSEDAISNIEREYKETIAQYPKASTYLKAKRWSASPNKWLRAIGIRAVTRLLKGVYWAIVAKDMEKERRDQLRRDSGGYRIMKLETPYTLTARNAAGVRVAI